MSRKTNNIPRGLELWKRHEALYQTVFSEALIRLSQLDREWGNEDQISEMLCLILSNVCFEIGKERNQEVRIPDWQKPIPPTTLDELKGGKKNKKPDFTCSLYDPYADTLETYEILFHIECKLLGKPSSPGWILNENYVTNGIQRFDCKIHEYGKRALSGMMIGYMVSMEPTTINEEVNGYLSIYLKNAPLLSFNFSQKICDCEQLLIRMNVPPSNFKLIHLWVDLRKDNDTH
jgi:hypothetical protein